MFLCALNDNVYFREINCETEKEKKTFEDIFIFILFFFTFTHFIYFYFTAFRFDLLFLFFFYVKMAMEYGMDDNVDIMYGREYRPAAGDNLLRKQKEE